MPDDRCGKCGCWIPICRCDGNRGTSVHVFKPMMYNDICETPLWITGKKHLKRECDKHGVKAVRLM